MRHAIRLPTFLKMCQVEVLLQNPQHYENMKTGRVAKVARHHAVGQHGASGGFAVTRAEAAAVIRFNLHRLETKLHCENVKMLNFGVISG